MRIFLCSVAALALGTIALPALSQGSMSAGSMGGSMMRMPKCSTANPVVWANPSSKIYYVHGQKNFGTTKNGMYECRSTAVKAGFRAGKTGMSSNGMMPMGAGGTMGRPHASGSMSGGSMNGGSMSGGSMSGGSTTNAKPSGGAMSGGSSTTTTGGSAPAAGSGNTSPAPGASPKP